MRILKTLFSAVFVAGTIMNIGAAGAADLQARPYTKALIASVPSWTGFYAGANVGYGWQDPTVNVTPNDPNAAAQTVGSPPFNAGGGGNGGGGTAIPPAGYNITGALGGLQAGYNWQFNRSWLLGVEVDFNGADIKGSGASNFFFGGPAAANMTASQKVDWFGTVRARVGWLPSDNLLLFATGGFAYGHVKQDVALNQPTGISNSTSLLFSYSCIGMPSRCFAGSSSQVANGWAAGAGAEYAISQNVTLKAEYLHVDFGDTSAVNVVAGKVGFPGTTPSSFTAKFSDLNFNVVRVGANYRF